MANKNLFPNAQALPPKAPKIKSSRWTKKAVVPGVPESPATESTTGSTETTAPVPAVEPMTSAESSKPKPKPKKAGKLSLIHI